MSSDNILEHQTSCDGAKKLRLDTFSYTKDEIDREYSHTWTISNFSLKMKMFSDDGGCIKSGKFSIMVNDISTDWYLRLHPNGDDETEEGFISLYLVKETSCAFDIPLKYTFSIINTDGHKTHSLDENHVYSLLENVWSGDNEYVSHEVIKDQKDMLLPNDCLTILCELYILGKQSITSNTHKLSESQPSNLASLSQDFSSIFEDGILTDFSILCKGKEFRCHASILAGRSKVFNAMFSHNTEEKRNKLITIEDFDSDVVHAMLKYIYSGQVKDLTKEIVKGLLLAADKYNLMGLKDTCEATLCKTIGKDTVIDLLILSNLCHANSLRSLALKFTADNLNVIMEQDDWYVKLEGCPELLADMLKEMAKSKNIQL